MTSLLTTILGTDTTYDAFITKVNNLISYRHSLDNANKTASYTAAITDQLAVLDSTSGALTVTLPAAASSTNATLWFLVKDATNTITLDGNSSETINGSATLVLTNKYQWTMLWCDGSGWWALNFGVQQLRTSFRTETTTYTATIHDEVILADATVGGFTITLPTAASAKGKVLLIKATSVAGGNVTIDGDGAETIDGAATLVISTTNRCVQIASTGTNWQLLSST